MMLPTQDKQLRQRLIQMVNNAEAYWTPSRKDIEEHRTIFIDDILKEFEQRGYHRGLPSSIEEALNSGDGVYRP